MKKKNGADSLDLGLHKSIAQVSEKIVVATKDLQWKAKTEEDLRIGFEKILEPLLNALGIESNPLYEHRTIYRGRIDALHGQIIVEYESPNSFGSKTKVDKAIHQLQEYIKAESERPGSLETENRFVGVGFDGFSMFFVRSYRGKLKEKDKKELFQILGPYPFNPAVARTFLTYLRALHRLPLTAKNLAEKFGPKSNIAVISISALADALRDWGNKRVQTFFQEWKRLFGIVYGEKFNSSRGIEAEALSSLYGVRKEIDFQEMLFSVHTYFAFLMKLIAAELVMLQESGITTSFSEKITHCTDRELEDILNDIEDGGIYAKRGITNFLEGDFFRWYINALSPRLIDAIREIARGIAEFEPATTAIDKDAARDLLKKLYQYLVPAVVRHNLGEYYTPEWLAEFVLDKINYHGQKNKRMLDPACGSGTFLVLAIQRAREAGIKNGEKPLETAKRIVSHIWGFDLNPIAVIASRTNYLFALGELVHQLSSFEIPIYLADSVLWPERNGQMWLKPEGETIAVQTSAKTFFVPTIWVKDRGFLMKRAAPLVETLANKSYSVAEALDRLRQDGLVFSPHEDVVKRFYEELIALEKEGRNGIWARFLKNAFAPMIAGQFDLVIGNPPWIRWGFLSDEYRAATLEMWNDYGLFSLKGHAARLGGGEKDFSMLFTYAVADHFLKKHGKLGFLITQEVFKSKGAGEGFRRFRIGNGDFLQVLQAHDFVKVQPFEGAANKSAAIFLQKGPETSYPVSYTLWTRKKGVGQIATDSFLKDALPLLHKKHLKAQPIGGETGSWQTIAETQKKLSAIEGGNFYQARLGARVEPYGIFWLEIKEILSDGGLLIRNLVERGKRKIRPVEMPIESDLIYPAVRGSDIQRWRAIPEIYILMCQNPEISEPYPEAEMKKYWPRTYDYLAIFRRPLETRGSKAVRQFAQRTEFYAMFGIGPYTVARYKVVWKRMSNDITAAVIAQWKTPYGFKKIIPTDTTSLFAADSEDEAHYLCAIINSLPVREFIKSYSSAGRGFGAPSIMNHIGIPEYEPEIECHNRLSNISKQLHDLAMQNQEKQRKKLEKDLDATVKELFHI